MMFSTYTSLVFVTSFVSVRAQNVARPVADLMNSFGFAFQNRVFGDEKGNAVFSPFSMYSGVAMLYLGANGGTKEELENLLKINSDNQEKFLQSLEDLTITLSPGPVNGINGVSVNIAVNGWLNCRFRILEKFRHQVRKYFGVWFKRMNFERPESARKSINNWVSRHTESRINELFPASSIDSMTKMVLANAIYFKGQWTSPFDKKKTYIRSFRTESGSYKRVPFMAKSGMFSSGAHQGVELLELPYGTKGEFTMLFAKPITPSRYFHFRPYSYQQQPGDFSDISTLSKQMTPTLLKQFHGSLSKSDFDIRVPRFTLKKKIDLTNGLHKLGITKVFQPGAADLSRINGKKNLYVSTAQHEAFVQVDEEGTVAAAATGMRIMPVSMRSRIVLDSPFLFYIIHKPQNAVVFAGKVADPSL